MILVDTTVTYPDAIITYATAYPTYSPDESAGITQNRLTVDSIDTGTMPSLDGLDMTASNEQVRAAGSFGELPLIVSSQTPGPDDFPGVDPAAAEQLAALIIKVQADLTKLSTRGGLMVAQTSNHFISLYEPQFIIDVITQWCKKSETHDL